MVSTRQMSSVSNGSGGESSSQTSNSNNDSSPAKFTRHNTVIALASQSMSHPIPSTSKTVISYEQWIPDQSKPDQSVFLLDLPQEVLEKIFSFLSFKTIAHLRPVSIMLLYYFK